MSKWLHYVIIFIFILFGAIQFNDPDFWLWTPVYWIISVVSIMYLKNRLTSNVLLTLLVIYSLFTISYIPDIIDWVQGGMDNIAGSMKAEEPHIELTREFFGLIICLIPLIFYHQKIKSKK